VQVCFLVVAGMTPPVVIECDKGRYASVMSYP
jgi:hypothetical protein